MIEAVAVDAPAIAVAAQRGLPWMEVVPWVLLAVASLGLCALFSGIETGIYTLNPIGLAVRVGRREGAAVLLDRELQRPDRVLSTILIGNNLLHYLSGLGIAAVLELGRVGAVASVIVNTMILLPATFVFAETLPKDLFRTYTDRWTYLCAGYLRAWRWVLTVVPLVPIVVAIAGFVRRRLGGDERLGLNPARERISELIREGVPAGVLSEAQTTLADRVLTARERTIGGEMTPWARVASISVDASREERASILRRSLASRLPVIDRSGRAVGVLTALDAILAPEMPTAKLMREPVTLAPNEPALAALRTLRSRRARLGIVTDRTTGAPLGVVAIKDLIEPITGQLVGS